jgi:beta-glucosidase
LPLTYYKSLDDLPAFDDYDLSNRTYKFFKGDVIYPFGFGLSYSKFKYSDLKIKENENGIDVSFTIKNEGRYDGDEVAQVYVRLPEYEGVAPKKELRGFKRVNLKKGEQKKVTVNLRREDLRYWSESQGKFIYPAGIPAIMVGASSEDIRLTN